jgi:hypothetical protein
MADLQTIETYTIGNPVFRQRFAAARVQAAWNIIDEATPDPDHLAWAKKIFRDYAADLQFEYTWFLSHTLVQTNGANISDADMVTAVESFIDDWSASAA